MRYRDVVATSRSVSSTSRRIEKIDLLAALLAACEPSEPGEPSEIVAVVGMLVGEPRQGRIGVGWASLRDARATAAERSPDDADAGWSVLEIDAALTAVAQADGPGSHAVRERRLADLLASMRPEERDHFHRLITGELRQGANEGVVTEAVARAARRPVSEVRRAAMMLGDLSAAAVLAVSGGSLDVGLTPLVAVQPMLAATSTSVGEAVRLIGPASVEWKLDGIRVQAHKQGDEVRLFTRGLRDITDSLPGIVATVRSLPARSIVLDGEALGVDEDGRPRRFQDTMSGLGTTAAAFFDVLHLDGRSLVDEPLADRRHLLASAVPEPSRLPGIETSDVEAAEAFARGALAAGHEGVMVKALDAPYVAGRRGATWRKVKPVHTLDLVVLAVEWGHGRRAGLLSNLHLGARSVERPGEFVMVGKTFKGLTDELLRWQTSALHERAIATDGHVVHVRPDLVVEIAIDGVQVSRRYPGGVALRFARVRRYRPERSADAADTIERVQGFLHRGADTMEEDA